VAAIAKLSAPSLLTLLMGTTVLLAAPTETSRPAYLRVTADAKRGHLVTLVIPSAHGSASVWALYAGGVAPAYRVQGGSIPLKGLAVAAALDQAEPRPRKVLLVLSSANGEIVDCVSADVPPPISPVHALLQRYGPVLGTILGFLFGLIGASVQHLRERRGRLRDNERAFWTAAALQLDQLERSWLSLSQAEAASAASRCSEALSLGPFDDPVRVVTFLSDLQAIIARRRSADPQELTGQLRELAARIRRYL
jgi:hypothetical protein